MTKDERVMRAMASRRDGYNCAQSLGFAFSDVTGLEDSVTARALAGFGGGVGAQGEVCGVVSGMAFVAGMRGEGAPQEKGGVYRQVRDMTEMFRRKNGCILCRELKSRERAVPCDELIRQGVQIVDDYYGGNA